MRKRILALLLALMLLLCGIIALAEACVDGCEAVTEEGY